MAPDWIEGSSESIEIRSAAAAANLIEHGADGATQSRALSPFVSGQGNWKAGHVSAACDEETAATG